MLDLEKLTNEELGLIRLGLALISINELDGNEKIVYTEMFGDVEEERKKRAEKSLEETLKNIHWVCKMTGMDEDVVRKKVLRVYDETHRDNQVELK